MGSVRVDVHKSERQFELVSFSDFDAVKALIKYRDSIYRQGVGPVNPELIALYVSLDELIAKSNLNVNQKYIVTEMMKGRTEQQIAEEDYGKKKDYSQIVKMLNTAIKKITETHHQDWLYNSIYMNHMKAPFSYKLCTHCGEHKPMTTDFFNREPLGKDGFKNKCRACTNKK